MSKVFEPVDPSVLGNAPTGTKILFLDSTDNQFRTKDDAGNIEDMGGGGNASSDDIITISKFYTARC